MKIKTQHINIFRLPLMQYLGEVFLAQRAYIRKGLKLMISILILRN